MQTCLFPSYTAHNTVHVNWLLLLRGSELWSQTRGQNLGQWETRVSQVEGMNHFPFSLSEGLGEGGSSDSKHYLKYSKTKLEPSVSMGRGYQMLLEKPNKSNQDRTVPAPKTLQTVTRRQQLLSFISSPCKGRVKFSSIPFLPPSPHADQRPQALSPGEWHRPQTSPPAQSCPAVRVVKSVWNPPRKSSTREQGPLNPKKASR